jgi:hypothetical protein
MLRHWKIMACNALVLAVSFGAGPVYAGNCFNPTGNEGDIIYSYDYHVCSSATAPTGLPSGDDCLGPHQQIRFRARV